MSSGDFKKRVIAIARGEYKPKEDEPKVWFESAQTMAQVLSRENMELLKIIIEHNPTSIQALANASGRAKSNLSRTLKTMSKYGIVELKKQGRTIMPIVLATDFNCEIGVSSYYPWLFDRIKKNSDTPVR